MRLEGSKTVSKIGRLGDGVAGGGWKRGMAYGYFSRASDMMERECRHWDCTFLRISVLTSS